MIRILLALNFLALAILGAAVYLTLPERKYFHKNYMHLSYMYRGFCNERAYGVIESDEYKSLTDESKQFEMGKVIHLPEATGQKSTSSNTVVHCRDGYTGFSLGVNSPNPFGPTHVRLDNPWLKPVEVQIESGQVYIESMHLRVSLHESPQHLLLVSNKFMLLDLSGGEIDILSVITGDLEITSSKSIEEANGLARVLQLSTGPQSTITLDGKLVLGPSQIGTLLPSGFSLAPQFLPKATPVVQGGSPSAATASQPNPAKSPPQTPPPAAPATKKTSTPGAGR